MPHALSRDDTRALALVARFGHTATAFQVLGRGLSHWFDTDRGMVAYVDTGAAWVAAGEPVCARADAIAVAERFVEVAQSARRRVCFFATEGVLASSPRFRRTRIGDQPIWDPRIWVDGLRTHRSQREQLRRARAKGVRTRTLTPAELENSPALRAALERLVARWLDARHMAPMHFLVDVSPLSHLTHRRLFVAERHGAVLAVLSLAPVPARNGWLFEHLLRDPLAPNGTADLLVDHAMRTLALDDIPWVTLGLAPLAGPVSRWLRVVRTVARPFFNFHGLAAFKRKQRPTAWEAIYLAYPRERSGVGAMCDALRAFAGGSLVTFAMRTLWRGRVTFRA